MDPVGLSDWGGGWRRWYAPLTPRDHQAHSPADSRARSCPQAAKRPSTPPICQATSTARPRRVFWSRRRPEWPSYTNMATTACSTKVGPLFSWKTVLSQRRSLIQLAARFVSVYRPFCGERSEVGAAERRHVRLRRWWRWRSSCFRSGIVVHSFSRLLYYIWYA